MRMDKGLAVIVATTEITTAPGKYDRKEDYEQLFGSCFDTLTVN